MNTLIFIPALILVTYLVFLLVRKSNTSGTKFMLLGLSILLLGGIIAVDGNSDLGGFEYLIVFIGLILSVVGFGKDN
ncbi:hypothetical protein [Alkalibacillus almallahensis]|uniref:hypothetical protein n=1 Tax=Alkalibacillus almallahensis TaxID=1379154 RepID=UPI001ABB45FF|nr:hypothetical protein [Alkalibacillus almallahensis]NIK11650.1 hypothetical protein [Alkalibacillus almallahensis]